MKNFKIYIWEKSAIEIVHNNPDYPEGQNVIRQISRQIERRNIFSTIQEKVKDNIHARRIMEEVRGY